MNRFVFLKIGQGDFEKGFPLTLKIVSPDRSPFPEVEIDCEFPSNPKIKEIYERWIDASKKFPRIAVMYEKEAKECYRNYYDSPKELKSNLKTWLSSSTNPKFQRLRETLSSRLDDSDEIFVFLQTDDEILKKLPWQEWDLLSDRFPKSELVLSPPEIDFVPKEKAQRKYEKIRILSILGDGTGINIKEDRKIIENLPHANSEFLIEPDRQKFSNELWDKDWDILFFAGHSKSKRESGVINLNPKDRLPIESLKNSLKKVADRGLQLAIFNSCDGLKLAEYLAELKIPQIIVMREPVPDKVAQLFLKYFLQAYSRGESLYLAVREARSRLEAIEKETPGATWIPIIYQNFIQEPLIWRKNWRCDRTLTEHSDYVTAIAIHPDGKTFATGGSDKKIILWNLETGNLEKTCKTTEDMGISGKILTLAFSPDGKILASTSSVDGTIKLWDAKKLILEKELGTAILTTQITSIAFSSNGEYIAAGHWLFLAPEIRLWNLQTQKVQYHLKEHKWDVWSMKFGLNDRILVTGSHDGTIKIWNWKSETLINSLNRPKSSGFLDSFVSWADISVKYIWCIDINSSGNLIASGNSDGVIQIWKSDSMVKPWTVDNSKLMRVLTEHSGAVRALKFSPDGEILASAGQDCIIRMWNPYTGELLQTLAGHQTTIRGIAFSPDGNSLVSVSDDKTVKIWNYSFLE